MRVSGSGLHLMGSCHFGGEWHVSLYDGSMCSRWRFGRFQLLMKRRRFRRRVPRVVMRLVGAFEASFRQIFGGFLNVEGFCGGFYTEFEGLLSCSQNENFLLGERLSFSLLAFSGEFPLFPSSFSFLRFSAVGLFRSIWILWVCRSSRFSLGCLGLPRTA